MFENTKALIHEHQNSRMVRVAEVVGGLAVTYAGFYLLQHGLDPNLSKGSTLRAIGNNLAKNTPFLKNRINE
jgi:hypothetical protein